MKYYEKIPGPVETIFSSLTGHEEFNSLRQAILIFLSFLISGILWDSSEIIHVTALQKSCHIGKNIIWLLITVPCVPKAFHNNLLIKTKFLHLNISMTHIWMFLLIHKSIWLKIGDTFESCYIQDFNNAYNNTVTSPFLLHQFHPWRWQRLPNWLQNFPTGKC